MDPVHKGKDHGKIRFAQKGENAMGEPGMESLSFRRVVSFQSELREVV